MYFFRKPLILGVASSLTRRGHPALSLPHLPLHLLCSSCCLWVLSGSELWDLSLFLSLDTPPGGPQIPDHLSYACSRVFPLSPPASWRPAQVTPPSRNLGWRITVSFTACHPRPSFCLDKIPLFPTPSYTCLWCIPLSSNCVASRCSGFHLSTFACAVLLVSLSMHQARTDVISLPVFALIPQDLISVALMSHSHPSLWNSYVHV